MSIPQEYKNTKFIKSLENDVIDFIKNGKVRKAQDLNENIDEANFREDCPPLYFTGDLESPYVFIMQNPHKAKSKPSTNKIVGKEIESLNDYYSISSNFGTHKLEYNNFKFVYKFDEKQVNFAKGLGLFPDHQEKGEIKYYEYMRNNKLQLEAIPYPSEDFNMDILSKKPFHLDWVFELINKKKRDVIIFFGKFQKILGLYPIASTQKYKFNDIKNTDGELRYHSSYLYKINFDWEYKNQTVWVASSYPSQSFMPNHCTQYGNKLKELLKA